MIQLLKQVACQVFPVSPKDQLNVGVIIKATED